MTSQRQWVLMYARRKELVVVPARYFKWDSARDWGLKFGAHFSAKLGMNFEEESAPALNNASFEFEYAGKAVTLHMRAGQSVLDDFGFLERYIPMAGTYVGNAVESLARYVLYAN